VPLTRVRIKTARLLINIGRFYVEASFRSPREVSYLGLLLFEDVPIKQHNGFCFIYQMDDLVVDIGRSVQ